MTSRIHHFLPECIAFNQSAPCNIYQSGLRHEQLQDAFSCGFQWEWLVVVFCSDLLVKWCERDCDGEGLGLQGSIFERWPVVLTGQTKFCSVIHVPFFWLVKILQILTLKNFPIKRPWLRKGVRPWKWGLAKFNETWWGHRPWCVIATSSFIFRHLIFPSSFQRNPILGS